MMIAYCKTIVSAALLSTLISLGLSDVFTLIFVTGSPFDLLAYVTIACTVLLWPILAIVFFRKFSLRFNLRYPSSRHRVAGALGYLVMLYAAYLLNSFLAGLIFAFLFTSVFHYR